MLVLSRKKNESIVINNDITVTVVEIRGDKVRLGIVAPKEVPVHRQEVYDAIHGKTDEDAAPTTVAADRTVVDGPVGRLDRVTVYLPPERALPLLPEIARKPADEVWFNPGADAPEVVAQARGRSG